MASRLVFASLTSVALLKPTTADTAVPGCFHTCMVQSQTDNICSSNALSDLTTCLTKLCVNPVDTQSLVAGLGVSISPKLEYSCKMSMVPAASDDGATLALNGSCSTSPYPFKSFFPQGVGSIAASNGCKIEIYSEEDCLGSAGSVDIGTSQNSQCIFRGGRSARLACNNELDAARAYIDKACGTSSADSDTSLAGYGPASTSSSGPMPSSSGSLTWITLGTPSLNPSASPASASTGPATWTPFPTLTFPSSTPSPTSSTAGALTGSTSPSWATASDTSIHTMTIPWIPVSGTGSTSSMTITVSPASESSWPPASWSSSGNATWSGASATGSGNLTLTNGPTGTASSSVVLGTYTGVAARVGHDERVGFAAVVAMGVAALL